MKKQLQLFYYNAAYMYYNWHTRTLWRPDYKGRIQESLDQSVKYCAKALNFIADSWAEGGKKCNEEGGDKKPLQQAQMYRWLSMALAVLVSVGLACASALPLIQLYALVVVASSGPS